MSSLLSYGDPVPSVVWSGQSYPVSQPFGEYSAERAEWYQYAADHGWPAGTHIGIDVAVPKFTPIYANEDGEVVHSGWSDSFRPNPVWIKENDGDTAIYGHLWESTVPVGKSVKRGDLLGYSGEQTVLGTMTPDGSGPHVHYELRDPNGMAIDPAPELLGFDQPGSPATPGQTAGGVIPGGPLLNRVFTVGIGIVLIGVGVAVFVLPMTPVGKVIG